MLGLIIYIGFGQGVKQGLVLLHHFVMVSVIFSTHFINQWKNLACILCWTPSHLSGPPDLAPQWLRKTQEQGAKKTDWPKSTQISLQVATPTHVYKNLHVIVISIVGYLEVMTKHIIGEAIICSTNHFTMAIWAVFQQCNFQISLSIHISLSLIPGTPH